MQASVQGRVYVGRSWADVLSAALRGEHAAVTTSDERRSARNALGRGVTVIIGGIQIKPEGARE